MPSAAPISSMWLPPLGPAPITSCSAIMSASTSRSTSVDTRGPGPAIHAARAVNVVGDDAQGRPGGVGHYAMIVRAARSSWRRGHPGRTTHHGAPEVRARSHLPLLPVRRSSSTSTSAASSRITSRSAANKPELNDAQRILADEAARRESIFQQSVDAEKNRGDALARRFEEALRQAHKEPVTKPTRDFDLD